MKLLGNILIGFVAICETVVCFRCAKIAVKKINQTFDKIEEATDKEGN